MTSKHLKAPYRADVNGGYIFNADGLMFAQIRGWGQLQYEPNPRETQDEHLQYLVDALNLKAELDAKEAEHNAYLLEKLNKRAVQDACEHKNTRTYKDYYSKIITCKDCGLEW